MSAQKSDTPATPAGPSPKRKRLMNAEAKVAVLPLSEFKQIDSRNYVFKLNCIPEKGIENRTFKKDNKDVKTQVLNFILYDSLGKSFEGCAWEVQAHELLKVFQESTLPGHFKFSNVSIRPTKSTFTPKTDYKAEQLHYESRSKCVYTPGCKAVIDKRMRICTCEGTCDGYCTVVQPEARFSFARMSFFLKGETVMRFRWTEFEIVSEVQFCNNNESITCTVTDGVHKAFYEGPFIHDLADGTSLRVKCFEARFRPYENDSTRLLITCSDEKYVENLGNDDTIIPYEDDELLTFIEQI